MGEENAGFEKKSYFPSERVSNSTTGVNLERGVPDSQANSRLYMPARNPRLYIRVRVIQVRLTSRAGYRGAVRASQAGG